MLPLLCPLYLQRAFLHASHAHRLSRCGGLAALVACLGQNVMLWEVHEREEMGECVKTDGKQPLPLLPQAALRHSTPLYIVRSCALVKSLGGVFGARLGTVRCASSRGDIGGVLVFEMCGL
jgi:hypothetical protein